MKNHVMGLITKTGLALAIGCAALSVKAIASDVNVGTYADGLKVGARNGTLIAQRVYKATVGKANRGCAALGQFQNALNTVTSTVRPSGGSGTAFAAGFYQGYLDAVRDSLREVRSECKVRRFSDGIFPGALLANVYCQVAADDAAILQEMRFGPVYDGWSGGDEVRDSCSLAFEIVAGDCATGLAAELLGGVQAAACAD